MALGGSAGAWRIGLLCGALLLAAACADPARERFERAEKELLSQKMEAALSDYRYIARDHPQSRYAPAALLRQGDLYGGYYRNFPAALEAYGSLVYNYPRASEVPARAAADRGDPPAAIPRPLLGGRGPGADPEGVPAVRGGGRGALPPRAGVRRGGGGRAAGGGARRTDGAVSQVEPRGGGAMDAGVRAPRAAPVRRRGPGVPQAPVSCRRSANPRSRRAGGWRSRSRGWGTSRARSPSTRRCGETRDDPAYVTEKIERLKARLRKP